MKQVPKFLSLFGTKSGAKSVVLLRRISTITHHDDRLEIRDSNWKKSVCFNNLWLRDHCRCPQCYHVNTNQRLFDLVNLQDQNVKSIKSAEAKVDRVVINWNDGHVSEFALDWLHANKYVRAAERNIELWDGKNVVPERFEYDLYMGCDSTFRRFLSALIRKGFAIVDGVPPYIPDTRMAIERLAPVMPTFYGEMWEFSDNLEYSDTAYTSAAIGSHTDTTYLLEAAGLQVLHCLKHDGKGGENILVDGFNCARQLKEASTDGYKMLSNVSTVGEYVDKQRFYKNNAPVFVHSSENGELIQVRYNIYDRAPLRSVPTAFIPDYYRHLIHLSKIVREPENEFRLKLRPGTVLFMDNWRLLHGRTEYSGKRVMTGSYVNRSDFESVARVNGLIS